MSAIWSMTRSLRKWSTNELKEEKEEERYKQLDELLVPIKKITKPCR